MKNIGILLQYIIPTQMLSSFIGFFARCRLQLIKNRFILWFIKRYDVDMTIAQELDPLCYGTFNDFFTRKLKKEVRPIDENPDTIVCPVDGMISQLGGIENNILLQAKGFKYDLSTLLAGKYEKEFEHGQFITLYLSPGDYHRVHMPYTGVLLEMIYVPGRLFSVNPQATMTIPNLFTRNERVICIFKTSIGLMAVIMIGAMLVGSINTTWAGRIMPTKNRKIYSLQYTTELIELLRGTEMGYFEMGSTVIILFQSKKVLLDQQIIENKSVQMGQKLATRCYIIS